MQYKVGLADDAHAPLLKAPLLMLIASNELDNSIDKMSDTFERIENDSLISINPRANHTLNQKQNHNIIAWLDYHLKGKGELPTPPQIEASQSEHYLYYNVSLPPNMSEPSLYTSQAMPFGALRNWHKETLTTVEDGKYIARVDVHNSKEPIYAFVNGECNGIQLSTTVLEVLPAMLGVTETAYKKKRLIYDGSTGTDDWVALTPLADEKTINIKQGPFGIDGVSSALGTISTFKLSDPQYRGQDGMSLQLSIYSSEAQDITITLTSFEQDKNYAEFSTKLSIKAEDNWVKLTLDSSDFKSPHATMSSLANVVNFRVDSNSPIIISSLIWI